MLDPRTLKSSASPRTDIPKVQMRPRSHLTALLLIALALSTHCNATRFAVRRSGPLLKGTLGVLSSYRDLQMARQAAPGLLVLLEGLLAADPRNKTLLELLCQGLYEYTFGFLQQDYESLEGSDPDAASRMRLRARRQYLRVYELGLRLLRIQGAHLTLQRTPIREIRRQIATLDRHAVPGLVWTAVGAGGALQLGIDEPRLLQMRPGIPALLKRAAALDPGYGNALPLGALGLYYGRSRDAGGSALESQRYFREALRRTGRRYLLWLVLYARHWAWQFQSTTQEAVGTGAARRTVPLLPRDRKALFVRLLQEVHRFPIDRAPSLRLPNLLAKKMATRLWPRREDFLDPLPPARARPAPGARSSTPAAPTPRRTVPAATPRPGDAPRPARPTRPAPSGRAHSDTSRSLEHPGGTP